MNRQPHHMRVRQALAGCLVGLCVAAGAGAQDSARVRMWLDSAAAVRPLNVRKAERLAQQALQIAKRLPHPTLLADAHYERGLTDLEQGRLMDALDHFDTGIQLYRKSGDSLGIAKGLSQKGIAMRWADSPVEAMEFHRQAMRMRAAAGDPLAESVSATILADLLIEQNRLDSARSLLDRAYAIRRAKYHDELASVYFGYGKLAKLEGKSDSAYQYFKRAEISLLHNDQLRIRSFLINQLASAYRRMNRTNDARVMLETGLQLVQNSGALLPQASIQLNLARIELDAGNMAKAEQHLKEVIRVALEMDGYAQLQDAYRMLSEIAERRGNYQLALRHYQSYQQYRDSLYSESRIRQLTQLAFRYQVAQSEERLERMEAEAAANASRRKLLIVIIALVVAASVLLFLRYRTQRRILLDLARKNKALLLAQEEIERQMHLVDQRTEALHRAVQEKDEVIGIAAHDLKNPIAAIRIFAGLLKDNPGDLPAAQVEEFAQKIALTADQMMDIVSNLLDINRIEQGHLTVHLAPVSAAMVLDPLVSQYTLRAAQKQIQLLYEPPLDLPLVRVDARRLMQVLDNLLSNAVKFSPRGAKIFLRVVKHGDNVRFEVQDQGPGIQPDDHALLFQKFSKLSARPTGGESSTGLGLNIVQRLTELMGGEVGVESEPGRGALFYTCFPVAAAEPVAQLGKG